MSPRGGLATGVGVSAAVALGVAAGAMLAEAGVLVPWWRFLPAEAFLVWYAENASRLLAFYGPLEVVAAALALAAAAVGGRRAGRPWFVVAAALAVGMLLTFPLYFRRANASFAGGGMAPDEVAEALRRWAGWHWARTCMGLAGCAAAVLGVRADAGGRR